MALDAITNRLNRITSALTNANVPYALVGGQAVALWVTTKDPAAVRTTKDVDILIDRKNLPAAKRAAIGAGFDYFEVVDVGMFLERTDPNPRSGVHLIWAGEKVTPSCAIPSPDVQDRQELEPGKFVVQLPALVGMKLVANRDHDRGHLRDMISVGLIDRAMLAGLPTELASRLDELLVDAGL
ncbi:MAG: hypothetical protein EXS16_12850 [Gemmataceae bacterium]|nr:hypothetical protein [Gemmataceae bacterium]